MVNAADGKNLDRQCTKLNMQILSLGSLADNGAKKTVSAIIEPMLPVPKIQTRLLLSKTGYCVKYRRIFFANTVRVHVHGPAELSI